MPSPYMHFRPTDFIRFVRESEFNSTEYTRTQSVWLRAARTTFLSLPEREQERLATIADALPGRRIRSYGAITAFELLVNLAFLLGDEKGSALKALERMDANGEKA